MISLRHVAIGAVFFGSASCAHRHRDVGAYFPLAVGDRWTYSVRGPAGDREEIFEIVSEATGSRGEHRYLLSGSLSGEGTSRYYLRAGETIGYSVSEGIWSIFLQGPLTLGRRFDGGLTTNEGFHVQGETAADPDFVAQRPDQPMLPIPQAGYKVITSLSRSVTVPAGTFSECLEISHLVGTIVGVKYFAPGVGLVLSEAWSEDRSRKKRTLVSRQALLAYTVAGKSSP